MGPSPGFGAGVIHRLCTDLAFQPALSPLLLLPARREAAAHSLRLAIRDIMLGGVGFCVVWYRRVSDILRSDHVWHEAEGILVGRR